MFTVEDLKKRGLLYTSYETPATRRTLQPKTQSDNMLTPSQLEFMGRRAGDGRYTPKTDTELQLEHLKRKNAEKALTTTFESPEVFLPDTGTSGVSKLPSQPAMLPTATAKKERDTAPTYGLSLSQQEYFRNRYNNTNRIREVQRPDFSNPQPVAAPKKPIDTGFEVLSPGYVDYSSKDAAVKMVNTSLSDLQTLSDRIASLYYTRDGLRYRPASSNDRFIEQLQTIRSAVSNAVAYLKSIGEDRDDIYNWANGVLNTANRMLRSIEDIRDQQSRYPDEAAWNSALETANQQKRKLELDVESESQRLNTVEGNLNTIKAGLEWVDRLWHSQTGTPEEEQALYNRIDRWYTDICTMLKPYGYNILYNGTSEGMVQARQEIDRALSELSQQFNDDREFWRSSVYQQLGDRLTKDALNAEDYTATTRRYDPSVQDAEYQFINTRDLSLDTAFVWLNRDERDALLQMTDQERNIYNYYYNTRGKDAADEYAYSLSITLKDRVAAERAEKLKGHTLLSTLYAIPAGLDQFESGMEGTIHAARGNDRYIVPSQTAVTGSHVRGNLDGVAGAAYDALQSISNMAPSVLTSVGVTALTGSPVVGSMVGSSMMGASAAGNAYVQAINKGKPPEQALGYAALIGTSETLLQYALGGITKLGGNTFKSVAKALDSVDNAFLRIGANIAASGIAEGSEEAIQEVLNPFFENIVVGANRNTLDDVDWGQAAYSFLIGAVTGGVFEGGSIAVNDIQLQKAGKAILAEDGALQALKDLATTMPEGMTSRKLASSLGDTPTTYQVGKLLSTLYDDMQTSAAAGKAASVLTVMEQHEGTVSGVKQYATAASVEAQTFETADTKRYSQAIGRKVVLYNGDANAENGFTENGTIYINASRGDITSTVVAHELTHTLQGTDAYTQLATTIKNSRAYTQYLQQQGLSHDALIQQKIATNRNVQGNFTAEQAEFEIIADFVGNVLIKNEQHLTELALTDRTLFQKMWQWVVQALDKLGVGHKAAERTGLESAFRKAYLKAFEYPTNNTTSYSIDDAANMPVNEHLMNLYDQRTYANHGWVVINGVLTAAEYSSFDKQFSSIKHLGYRYPQNAAGEYMITVGDMETFTDENGHTRRMPHANKIVFASGTVQNPIISKVVEVDYRVVDDVSYYVEELINSEQNRFDYMAFVESSERQRVYTVHESQNLPTYREIRAGHSTEQSVSTRNANRREQQQRRGGASSDSTSTDVSYSIDDEIATPLSAESGIDPQRINDAVNGNTRGVVDARQTAIPQTESTLSPVEIQDIQDAVAGKTRGRVIDVRGITPTTSAPAATPSLSTLSDVESQRITDAVDGKIRGMIDARQPTTAAPNETTTAEAIDRFNAAFRGERYVPTVSTDIDTNRGTPPLDTSLNGVYNRNADIGRAIREVEQGVAHDQQNVNAVAKPTIFRCINQKLKNRRHPITNVLFVERMVAIDGQQLIVIVPQFDSFFEAWLPESMRHDRDKVQFKECNRQLFEKIQQNPVLASAFTNTEIALFAQGITPKKFAWHHDADVGQMQLVLAKTHKFTGHTGGRAIWGGGKKFR